jgi:hypothetical protein
MRRAGPLRFGRQPYQGAFNIVKQSLPALSQGSGPRDQHIVMPGTPIKRYKCARRLTQTAFGAISDDGIAYALGRGKTDANRIRIRGVRLIGFAQARLKHKACAGAGGRLGALQKIRPYLQALQRRFCRGGRRCCVCHQSLPESLPEWRKWVAKKQNEPLKDFKGSNS